MATAGRIRHHLKHNLWDEKNSLVFVGYQAEGTLGRIILNGAKSKNIRRRGSSKSEIYDLQGFSGHADQMMLLEWIRKFKIKPQKIFIVHGEEDSSNTLAQLIEAKFNTETIIPNLGDEYIIKKEIVEFTEGDLMEPSILKKDIVNELENIYIQLQSLNRRKDQLVDFKLLEKDYDTIKNILINLQQNLMDLNMILGK